MDSSGGFNAPPPPPPPPGGGGVPGGGGGDVLPARSLGEILSAAFEIYKTNASSLIVIVAIVVVPLQFITHFLSGVAFAPNKTTTFIGTVPITTTSRSFGTGLLLVVITWLIAIVISAALQAAIIRAAAQTTVGDPVDVSESYRFGFAHFGGVLGASLLVGLIVGIGFILLLVPGVIFLTMLAVTIPALVIERGGVTGSMSRSWALAKGHFWHVLGTIVVATLIAGFVGGLIGAIGGHNWFVGWIFGSIGQIIVAPFSAMVTVLLYLDLRTRSEALTSAQLRSELASS